MRRVTAVLGAAVIALWATSAFAQGKDFTGKWTRDAPAGGAAAVGGGGGGGRGGGGGGGRGGGGGGGFNCAAACTIAQTAAALTINRPAPEGGTAPAAIVLKLDGTDSSNAGGREGAPPVVSKVKWDGDKLVVSTTRDMQGTAVTATQTIWLEGGKLVVESSSGREGQTPTKATYTKG